MEKGASLLHILQMPVELALEELLVQMVERIQRQLVGQTTTLI